MPVLETVSDSAPVAAPRTAPEPRLRQADRRPGGRTERDDAPAREGAGFGGDVPAFLRRAVTLKG